MLRGFSLSHCDESQRSPVQKAMRLKSPRFDAGDAMLLQKGAVRYVENTILRHHTYEHLFPVVLSCFTN
jgi:hypothetical protein